MTDKPKLQVMQNDGVHLLVRWGEVELIASIETGALWAGVLAPKGIRISMHQTELPSPVATIVAAGLPDETHTGAASTTDESEA